ncbi:MAG TPA: glycosyltransferase family 4 protein, partial [Verrucomicrobiae bacterium]
LRDRSHTVEIFSQGEVVERALKFYPGFAEPQPCLPDVPVRYSSVLPVRFINGFWQGCALRSLFRRRHRQAPFDAVLIYNLKVPQLVCAEYAARLGLPVVCEYEDDAFMDVDGRPDPALRPRYVRRAKKVLQTAVGGFACSPHLLAQLPAKAPRFLMRGVIGPDILRAAGNGKQNWVLFSGTHYWTKGIASLIEAWPQAQLPNWELHITGEGQETAALKKLAAGNPRIIFHGFVSAADLAQLMAQAKICINPHALSQCPGNVFAFKIVEYLAAGAHVISTPMGEIEKEIARGITFMPDNAPATIAATLRRVVRESLWLNTAANAVRGLYGPDIMRDQLDHLLRAASAPPRRHRGLTAAFDTLQLFAQRLL